MGFFGDLLNGVTGGIGSVISSGIGAIAGSIEADEEREFNAKQAQLNRDFQKSEREAAQQFNIEQMERENQFNIDMWNRQNEYNDPRAQMERMVAAGINPNVAAGNMSGGNVASGAVKSGEVRTQGAAGAQAASGSYAGSLASTIAGSVNDNLWANALAAQQVRQVGIENDYLPRQIEKQLDLWTSEIGLNDANKEQALETAKRIRELTPLERDNYLAQMSKTFKECLVLEEEVRLKQKEGRLIDEQVESEEAHQELLSAQTDSEKANKENIEASTKEIEARTDSLGIQNRIDAVTASFVESTGVPLTASDSQMCWNLYKQEYDRAIGAGKKPKDAEKIAENVLKEFVDVSTKRDKKLFKMKGQQDRRSQWNKAASDVVTAFGEEAAGLVGDVGSMYTGTWLKNLGGGFTPRNNDGTMNPRPLYRRRYRY